MVVVHDACYFAVRFGVVVGAGSVRYKLEVVSIYLDILFLDYILSFVFLPVGA